MITKHKISVFYLLFVLLYLLPVASCTYDYFEDETNYIVYVPKADKNFRTDDYCIEDLSILIYDENLSKERYSHTPFEENARSRVGNFNFRLFPGTHSVYCFTNVQTTNFYELNLHNTARFDLQKNTDGYYTEPSAIHVEYCNPTILFPGPVVTDTALFENKYVGRICVAFKNLTKIDQSLTFSNIKRVDIEAGGIGVVQYLSHLTTPENTRSLRYSPEDKMRLSANLFDVEYKDFEFGLQNYYFPSPDLSGEGREFEPINLKLNFVGQNDNILYTLDINVIDRQGIPIILHMNETLIVEVDGNNIQILRLDNIEDWSPDIESGGNSSPGDGGIHI